VADDSSRKKPAVLGLGYLGFEVSSLDDWERLSTEILGLGVARRLTGGGFTLRMDGRAERFFVEPGALDDVSVIGWDVESEAALAVLAERVAASGIDVER